MRRFLLWRRAAPARGGCSPRFTANTAAAPLRRIFLRLRKPPPPLPIPLLPHRVPNPLGPGHLASSRLADPITKQEGFRRAAMREIAPHGEGRRRGAAAAERGRRRWKRRLRRKGR
ncbi:hypothetical protein ABZP36_008802 [Zizania latifolia]